MGVDQDWDEKITARMRCVKVHHSMCSMMIEVVERILRIVPQIEESRPGSSSGIQALCLLNTGLDKVNSLINHCSESSKLYLALTGDVVVQRFKRSRNLLNQSLTQIQNMVPVMLADEISVVICELKKVKISLNLCEEEAGKVMREYLEKGMLSDSDSKAAIDVMRFAASRLGIRSENELMVEKSCIKKLIGKVGAGEQTKKNILVYLLNLLHDHGHVIVKDLLDNYVEDENEESFSVMPVELDFDTSSSSCTSFASFNDFLHVPVGLSDVKMKDNFLENVEKLDSVPWGLQCSTVEGGLENWSQKPSTEVVDQLLKFAKVAYDLQDWRALKNGCRLLSTCFSTFRSCSLSFQAYELSTTLLGSEAMEEALCVIEALSCYEECQYTIAASASLPRVMKLLVESDSKQIQKSAISILKNLSSNIFSRSCIDPSNLIPRLTCFLEDTDLAEQAIHVFDNFCHTEEFMASVAEMDGFIGQIAKLLEDESREVQEHAVSVLHSLCTQDGQSCQLRKNEEIIPSLISISVNSDEKVKEKARVVLRLFQDAEIIHGVQEQSSGTGLQMERNCGKTISEKKASSRSKVFGMRVPLFSKRPSSK